MLHVREWMIVARRVHVPVAAIMWACSRLSLYTVKTRSSSQQRHKKIGGRQ